MRQTEHHCRSHDEIKPLSEVISIIARVPLCVYFDYYATVIAGIEILSNVV